jgi:alkanesulfonate monooxygenase SsuD/methylene tetrahydromethanopterin reductase-like flavin-dependent oxidoreductase (luciferase family)
MDTICYIIASVKVRIGVAIGALPLERFGGVVDDLDRLGFDSLWLPESFQRGGVDPLVGLSFAAARVSRLKLGTHLVAPGRNPYVLARELAQLDRLSGGRLLLTLVAGLDEPAERIAQGLPSGDRTGWFDEHLGRMRAWWAGEEVDGIRLDARPAQDPLEVWLGGKAHRALVRAGRLSDGWLAGRTTLEEAIAAKAVIDAAAADAGRTISPEHFGTNLAYAWDGSLPALREQVARWVDAGFTKLVVRPATPPDDPDGWGPELRRLADDVLDLQT